jgi:hypothetical protein
MRLLLASLALSSTAALSDEIVNAAPSAAELSRYLVLKHGDTTLRLDSATGTTWTLCQRKTRQGWCRTRDIPSLPGGPAGRYRLVEASPLLLLDTVTGRSWARCESPTPEKGVAWCALEE